MFKSIGITSAFLVLYIFCLSWGSVFRINAWLPVYNIFLFFGMFTFLFSVLIEKEKFIPKLIIFFEDWIILIFIVALSLTILVNPNTKSFNYFLAYFQVFIICFLFARSLIIKKLSLNLILNTNTAAMCFVGLFIIIEFFMRAFLLIDVHEFIPSFKEQSTAVVTAGVPRAIGLGTEPTQTGFYICTLGPIALWNLYKNIDINNAIKHMLSFIIFLSLIFIFSASAFIVIFLTLFMFLMFRWRWNLRIFLRVILGIVFLLTVIRFYEPLYIVSLEVFETIYGKITFSGGGTSSTARASLLGLGFERIFENPLFGVGLGYSSSLDETSSINWYVFLMSEIGIPSSLILFSYMVIMLIRIYNSNIKERNAILFGAFAGSAYLGTLSTFFYPSLWMIYIIFAKIIVDNDKS